ncbi:3-oxo-Delta(4,5)-steroid 5-beta-reductase-like [Solanum tuberosum]|uniref:Progesterone 5beta reductase-A n=1 Tax=Solanum tuberosum TaxID=4113 RepID=M1CNQ1_SOLTU|nr:PREDICTED: 3-oxo-Delta(4,5)-steroid 5-beta-reductase-like [Solanum tuberosum]
MNWWLSRSINNALQKNVEYRGTHEISYQNVGLIIGVTGVVGNSLAGTLSSTDTPGGPWKVYGVSRRGTPVCSIAKVTYIQCDVSKATDVQAKLSTLKDVTHIFWVTLAFDLSTAKSCEINGAMFRNVLTCVIPNAPNLRHICLQTGGMHYMGIHKSIDGELHVTSHDPPFNEDMKRLENIHNFYYTLEDVLFDEVSRKPSLTWSVHRPDLIFGFSPYSSLNIIGTLCVYATICKFIRIPMKFPGTEAVWDSFSNASDANLVAEHQIWAAMCPQGKNRAFNITNGDVFKWKHLWKVLAEEIGVEYVGFDATEKIISLSEMMKDKGPVWDKIVRDNKLISTKLEEVGLWDFADMLLGGGTCRLSSINRSKENGFIGFRNSINSFIFWIHKAKHNRLIP